MRPAFNTHSYWFNINPCVRGTILVQGLCKLMTTCASTRQSAQGEWLQLFHTSHIIPALLGSALRPPLYAAKPECRTPAGGAQRPHSHHPVVIRPHHPNIADAHTRHMLPDEKPLTTSGSAMATVRWPMRAYRCTTFLSPQRTQRNLPSVRCLQAARSTSNTQQGPSTRFTHQASKWTNWFARQTRVKHAREQQPMHVHA